MKYCGEDPITMSLDMSGGDMAVQPGAVSITVTAEHPLLKLANALPWMTLVAMVMSDLKSVTSASFFARLKPLS